MVRNNEHRRETKQKKKKKNEKNVVEIGVRAQEILDSAQQYASGDLDCSILLFYNSR